ncbi:hypothetical protein IWX90DRAFT_481980 [Phyllosticta citrichinensis]|uniref:DUF6590 domain-containing protein n=1 Tax=Phyllosticta citrichinensis TaxID=1130410 RepID=A0ABR1Y5M6_9PEZI
MANCSQSADSMTDESPSDWPPDKWRDVPTDSCGAEAADAQPPANQVKPAPPDEESDEQTSGNNIIETSVGAVIKIGPAETVTDPPVLQEGIRARKRFERTPGDREGLDPNYVVRVPGYRFYRLGKVFRILWPEPAGNPQANTTFISGKWNENIFVKIRWFVVIREGHDCCTCLPIQTYQSQGVAKRGTIKSDHSIVFSERTAPSAKPREHPVGMEGGMRDPIRVRATHPEERNMDPMSRINYAKPYTVEHYVKSYDFGQVDPAYEHVLVNNFAAVWNRVPELGNNPTTETFSISVDVQSRQRNSWGRRQGNQGHSPVERSQNTWAPRSPDSSPRQTGRRRHSSHLGQYAGPASFQAEAGVEQNDEEQGYGSPYFRRQC